MGHFMLVVAVEVLVVAQVDPEEPVATEVALVEEHLNLQQALQL
jgi:hypothetical protein